MLTFCGWDSLKINHIPKKYKFAVESRVNLKETLDTMNERLRVVSEEKMKTEKKITGK